MEHDVRLDNTSTSTLGPVPGALAPSDHPKSVLKSVTVAATRERAFRLFTAEMGRWWPKMHSIGPVPMVDVVVEPAQAGRWFERGDDGSERQWGQVLVWEPTGRVVLAWQVNAEWQFEPGLITEVEIIFTEIGSEKTRVDLEHRNFDRFGVAQEGTQAAFDSPNGWSGILEGFANAAQD